MKESRIVQTDMDYIRRKFARNEVFQDKTVIITGFGGFLGYYLTQYFMHLAQSGVKLKSLVLLDNFTLGRPVWLNELAAQADFPVHIETFNVVTDRFSAIPGVDQVNYVLHLASIASPTFYRQYPIETLDANVWGLRQLLDFYVDKPVEGMLFFSSSEIYGDPDPACIPTDEDYKGNVSCVGPRACYDEAKRFGETMCSLFAQKYQMPIGVARPFNNYGPGMSIHDKRVPADFAQAVLHNEDIVMYSDGLPTRTYCYVADAIVGYLKVLTYGKYDYFNIGIDKPEISVRQLAEIYQQLGREHFGYTGKIRFATSQDKHYLTDNPSRRCPDISKARKLLNYSPEIELTQGLKQYLLFGKDQ